MTTKPTRRIAPLSTLLALAFAGSVHAQVVRIELKVAESPAYEGRRFGEVGQYERLRGAFFGEVDPTDPRNAEIVLLDRAPRNDRGMVEYTTTVEIIRPVDMTRWNGAIYHTVPNRGGAVAGDPTLLERGFALVQVGWQGDLAPTARNVTPTLPIARNPDAPRSWVARWRSSSSTTMRSSR
jgi:hypothetical protein